MRKEKEACDSTLSDISRTHLTKKQRVHNALLFFLRIAMQIITYKSIDSTNKQALIIAGQGAENGTAIVAEEQTMGRGRLGRRWQSPAGNGLYCSIIVRPQLTVSDFPRLTFVAGLAVAQAINTLYDLEAGLKWPNDIYFHNRKCGGILTESSSLSGRHDAMYAVIGIGLNVNTERSDFPEEIESSATSLYLESGVKMNIDLLLKTIRSCLLDEIARFETEGFNQAISRWRKRDFMKGTRMAWVAVDGRKVEGISLGPDDDGLLHVLDDCGQVHEVLSGDIQLATQKGREWSK